jgi:hypothetical protein
MIGRGGLGLITSSNFFVPQINRPGSMATFVAPAAILAPAPVTANSGGLCGLGQAASDPCSALTMMPTPACLQQQAQRAAAAASTDTGMLSVPQQYALSLALGAGCLVVLVMLLSRD